MRTTGFLLTLVLGMGCAGTAPVVEYVPPREHLVSTVALVDEPPADVWGRLVQRLPGNGFVVERSDPESGKIVVSLATEAADAYADCGAIASGAGKKRPLMRSTWEPGRNSTFRQAALLRGTVYITVEEDRDGTLVSLKPYYDVFVDTERAGYRWRERWVSSPGITGPDGVEYGGEIMLKRTRERDQHSRRARSLSFVTNSPNEFNWGTERDPLFVTCCSTGKLEALVLKLAGAEP